MLEIINSDLAQYSHSCSRLGGVWKQFCGAQTGVQGATGESRDAGDPSRAAEGLRGQAREHVSGGPPWAQEGIAGALSR